MLAHVGQLTLRMREMWPRFGCSSGNAQRRSRQSCLSSSISRVSAEVAQQIRQPLDCFRVVGEVQHELLPSADGPQVGVVSVVLPASAFGVVGQGRPVAVGIEPPWESPLGNAGAVGVGQNQPLVEFAKYSRSRDFAAVVVTVQFELRCCRVDGVLFVAVLREEVGMMACPWEVIWPDVGDLVLLADLEPAPQDVQFRISPDKAVSLGRFLQGIPLRDYASSMNVESGMATMRGSSMGGASS